MRDAASTWPCPWGVLVPLCPSGSLGWGWVRQGVAGPYRESGLSRTSSAWSSPTLARRQRCSRAVKSRVLHSRTVRSSAQDARYLPLLLKSRQETEPLWPCGERRSGRAAGRRWRGRRRRAWRGTGLARYLQGGDQQPVGEAVLLRPVPAGPRLLLRPPGLLRSGGAAVRPGACGERRARVGSGLAGQGQRRPAPAPHRTRGTHRPAGRREDPAGERGAARPPAAEG